MPRTCEHRLMNHKLRQCRTSDAAKAMASECGMCCARIVPQGLQLDCMQKVITWQEVLHLLRKDGLARSRRAS